MAALNFDFANFELHRVAVSDHIGKLYFLNEEALSTTNRVVSAVRANEEKVTIVQADTLDNMLNDRFDRIVMKMDIEGGEEKAFIGADRLFRNKKIKLVMFERLGRTNLSAIQEFMTSHKYQIFRVLSSGILSTSSEEISIPLINLFACPAEAFADLKRIAV